MPQLVGRGHRAGGKGGGLLGGRGQGGKGKGKGQLSLRLVGTLVVRERMGKALAVQSGRPLPMGRCASPPWPLPVDGSPDEDPEPRLACLTADL